MSNGSPVRRLCRICGVHPSTHASLGKWRTVCKSCLVKPYTRAKKPSCEECGFVPVHPCQLDVDHVDGNKANASPENLRTLCANCHRLKTQINKEWTIRAA